MSTWNNNSESYPPVGSKYTIKTFTYPQEAQKWMNYMAENNWYYVSTVVVKDEIWITMEKRCEL